MKSFNLCPRKRPFCSKWIDDASLYRMWKKHCKYQINRWPQTNCLAFDEKFKEFYAPQIERFVLFWVNFELLIDRKSALDIALFSVMSSHSDSQVNVQMWSVHEPESQNKTCVRLIASWFRSARSNRTQILHLWIVVGSEERNVQFKLKSTVAQFACKFHKLYFLNRKLSENERFVPSVYVNGNNI